MPCKAAAPVCPEGFFQTAAPTLISDRQCKPLSVCNCVTEFEQAAPEQSLTAHFDLATAKAEVVKFAISNRICTTITSQPTDKFETAAPTITSDRQLAGRTCCGAGKFKQFVPGTELDRRISDGQCLTCATGSWSDAEFQVSAAGLTAGFEGADEVRKFASDYSTKGLHCYNDGKYKGCCFYGTGGTAAEESEDPVAYNVYRLPWTEECDERPCTKCVAGHYGAGAHDAIAHCKECEVGTASNELGKAGTCDPCSPLETFAANKGQLACDACSDAGSEAGSDAGSEFAAVGCEPGQYRSRRCAVSADRKCDSIPAIVNWAAPAVPYTENAVATTLASQAVLDFDSNNTLMEIRVHLSGGDDDASTEVNDRLEFSGDSIIAGVFSDTNRAVTLKAVDGASDNKAGFQAALRRVQYINTGDMDAMHKAVRNVDVTATACHASDTALNREVCSAPVDLTLKVHPVNDAPTVAVAHEGLHLPYNYTQNTDAVRVLRDVTVNDVDHSSISSATIRIVNAKNGYALTADVSGNPGVNLEFDPETGTLVLVGDASESAYADMLSSVAYRSAAHRPRLGTRGLRVEVKDAKNMPSEDTSVLSSITVLSAPGFFEDAVTQRIEACPPGSYQTEEHKPACIKCEAGKFGDVSVGVDKSSHCVQCPVGEYQLSAGKTECTKCAAGSKGFGEQNTVDYCVLCATGQYQSEMGATECLDCPGTEVDQQEYSDSEGAMICTAWSICGAGKFKDGNSVVSDGSCTECAEGTYRTEHVAAQPEERLKGCTSCNAGTYGDSSVATVLVSAHCQACEAGQFQGEQGRSGTKESNPCADCARGSTSGSGAAVCVQCDHGTYQDQVGVSSTVGCIECPVGKYGFDTNGLTPPSTPARRDTTPALAPRSAIGLNRPDARA